MIVTFLLAIIQLLLMIFICYEEVKRKSAVAFLWATLLLMFGIMHLIFSCMNQNDYSYLVLNEASIFVVLFEVAYIFGRGMKCWSRKVYNSNILLNNEVITQAHRNYHLLCLIYIFIIGSLIWQFTTSAGGILNTSWASMRSNALNRSYISFESFLELLYYAFGGIGCYFLSLKKYKLFVSVTLGQIFLTLLTRNRIMILPILISIISIGIFRIKRLKFRHIMLAVIGAIVVVYLVYGIRVFRHYGTLDSFINQANISNVINKISYQIRTSDGELGLRKYFYQFIANDNNYEGFNSGSTYLRMLMVYLPSRFAFDIKPSDFAVTMGWAMTGRVGQSIHPTLFGDAYANYNIWGFFIGFLWGKFANVCDLIVYKIRLPLNKILCFCLFAVSFIIIARGSVYNGFVYVAYGVPLLIVLDIFSTKIKFTVNGKAIKFNKGKGY